MNLKLLCQLLVWLNLVHGTATWCWYLAPAGRQSLYAELRPYVDVGARSSVAFLGVFFFFKFLLDILCSVDYLEVHVLISKCLNTRDISGYLF